MTKRLDFDLHFTKTGGVKPLTERGRAFLFNGVRKTRLGWYKEAIDLGLHVSFETSELRDRFAQ